MSREISIAPDFSVYNLIQRIENQSTLLNHRQTMSYISAEIENATLKDGAETYIFSGFQRFSLFLPQIERYKKLASQSTEVYVFGIPDVDLPEIPNIIYVPITKHHQLAKEWFLVSYGADYYSALATEELTDIDDPDETRMFKGIWSFDLQFVTILFEWLAGSVGLRPNLLGADQLNYPNQIKLMSNAMGRLLQRVLANGQADKAPVIQGELKTVVKESVEPFIPQ